MYETTQEELTEEFVWMCQSEVARTLARRHASPVWTDRDGCLTPVALMSARRLSALQAALACEHLRAGPVFLPRFFWQRHRRCARL